MLERQQEERHLAEANRHIAQAEERIRLQQEKLKEEQRQGKAAEVSQGLLFTMLDALDTMKIHREQILDRLADLDKLPYAAIPPLQKNSGS